jgi:hypothetical protein
VKATAAGLPAIEMKLSLNISDVVIVCEVEFPFEVTFGY